MVSFIISVDTTYEMADNFFELFFHTSLLNRVKSW